MSNVILACRNVGKYFDDDNELLAVTGVSLRVTRGEFLCIIGPSGCGKSTLLRMLVNLEHATEGQIQTAEGVSNSMIFQNFAVFPWLTVEENVGFGLKMQGLPEEEQTKRVADAIAEMGLVGFEKNHPRELSGGMKQRVGIARALTMQPDILFMDEPFSALDAFTADRLRQDILSIWKKTGMTIVMVTHLVGEAVEMADRVVVMTPRPGTIKEEIEIKLKRPRDPRSHSFYKYVDYIEQLVVQPDVMRKTE